MLKPGFKFRIEVVDNGLILIILNRGLSALKQKGVYRRRYHGRFFCK